MAACRQDGPAQGRERPGALARGLQQPVAVVDRGLAPDHDPGAVQGVEQPVVEQVVGAGDVGVHRLQPRDDAVDVGAGERGAAARHVLLDRRAAEVDLPAVEAQHPVDDADRAQADGAPLDLLGDAPGGERGRRRVEGGVVGRPQPGRAHGDAQADVRLLAGRERPHRLAGVDGLAAARRAQVHAQHRLAHRRRGAVDHGAVEQQRRPAAPAARARHLRQEARVAKLQAAARDELHGARDPAPVPPALADQRALAAVDPDQERVRRAGPQAGRGQVERDVGVRVAPDRHAVEPDLRLAPDGPEAQRPVEAARRWGRGERRAVPPDLAVEVGRLQRVVHDTGDRRRPPAVAGGPDAPALGDAQGARVVVVGPARPEGDRCRHGRRRRRRRGRRRGGREDGRGHDGRDRERAGAGHASGMMTHRIPDC